MGTRHRLCQRSPRTVAHAKLDRLRRAKTRAVRLAIIGPLFSEADKNFNELLVTPCDDIFDHTYLPQRDGGLLVEMIKRMSRAAAVKIIRRKNLTAIKRADVVLAVLDGRVPDEGMLIELGRARLWGVHCVALQTTPIRLLPSGNNPMIEGDLHRPPFKTRDEFYAWARAYVKRKRRRVK